MGPKALGTVETIKNGWPEKWPQPKKYKEMRNFTLARFDRYTLLAMTWGCFAEEDQWDFDIDKWLEYTNWCMPEAEQKDPKLAFDMKTFECCVFRYANDNYKWT